MVLSLVLLILSTLPSLVGAAVLLLLPLPPDVLAGLGLDQATLARFRVPAQDAVLIVRGIGGALLALTLVFMVLAVLAFGGRRWARVLVTVMAAGFVLLVLYGLVVNRLAATDLLVAAAIVVAAVAGTVLLHVGSANRYFARPGR